MTRPLRIEFNGALYHITSRGNARQAIFLNNENYINFFRICKLRGQRFITRPPLNEVLKYRDKKKRNQAMYTAHLQYAYTLKEIAEYLGIHYTTVSKLIKKGQGTPIFLGYHFRFREALSSSFLF